MTLLITQRLLFAVALLWVMTVVVFVATEVLPGDVAQAMLGQHATEGAVREIREELGLNRPAYIRYLEWSAGVVKGEFGASWIGAGGGTPRVDVIDRVGPRLFNTAVLALVTAAVAVPLALLLGVASALYEGTWFDRMANALAVCGGSVPEFFTGALLVSVFTVQLGLLPGIAHVGSNQSVWQVAHVLILPVLTLTISMVAYMTRMTRAAILSVMEYPYAEMAVLKGLTRTRIILHHALPNALSPIVNVVALNLAYLVGGVVVVEVIFAYPGMGRLMVDSVTLRDVPVVQACAVIFCATYICLNTVADVVSITTNPKLRYPR